MDFDDGGTARHEVGIEPVTIPSGNFLQSTLRPGNKLAFLDMNAVTASVKNDHSFVAKENLTSRENK